MVADARLVLLAIEHVENMGRLSKLFSTPSYPRSSRRVKPPFRRRFPSFICSTNREKDAASLLSYPEETGLMSRTTAHWGKRRRTAPAAGFVDIGRRMAQRKVTITILEKIHPRRSFGRFRPSRCAAFARSVTPRCCSGGKGVGEAF